MTQYGVKLKGQKLFLVSKESSYEKFQLVGEIVVRDGKKTLESYKRLEEHFFYKLQSWNLAEVAVMFIISYGVEEIRFITEKNVLVSYIKDWKQNAVKNQERGYEPQLCLNKKFWKKEGAPKTE